MNCTTYTHKLLFSLLLILFGINGAYSQVSFSTFLQGQAEGPNGLRRCSSVEVEAVRRMNNPNLPSIQEFEEWLAPKVAAYKNQNSGANAGPQKNVVIQIPVVVHILHNGEPVGTAPNITDAQVLSQIQVLNEDFRRILGSRGYNENPVGADLEIEFIMAQTGPDGNGTNGINRRNIDQDGVTVDDLENGIKAATIWDATQYMNMWSVKFVAPDETTLGYAQFPEGSGLAGLPSSGEDASTDGVVMRYQSFGTSDLDDGSFILDAPYDLGRTATHEVGHWIGLRHIWGDGLGCNMGLPAAGCSCPEDDFCDDTPNSDMANYGCPTDKTTQCDALEDPTDDMVENYMDYSDDPCMNVFTGDQKIRARTVMVNSPRRMELPTSPALFPPLAYVVFSETGSSVLEGSSCNERQIAVEVEITKDPTADVTATFGVSGGTADAGDFQLVTNTITFSSGGSTTANLLVNITEDTNVEGLESIILEITNVSGAGAAATYRQEHTIMLADDDYSPDLAGLQPGVTIFQETFMSGLGAWSQVPVGTPNVVWKQGSPVNGMAQSAYVSRTDIAGDLYTYDGLTGASIMLISPQIDASLSANMTLSFDYICFGEEDLTTGDIFDFGTVLYSCDDGTSWIPISDPLVNVNMATGLSINLPEAANGCATLRLGFRWENDELVSLDPPLSIDNVVLEGSVRAPVSIQENTNTVAPPSYDFGPMETLHVYDTNSGRLIMTLENQSSFDFGCTTITVDRSRTSAATNAVNFWNNNAANALAAKTFQLTSENIPITEQNVMVRMYYTQAEILAWEFATGNSRVDLQIVTVVDNPIGAVNSTNFGDFTIQLQPTLGGTFNTSNITVEAVVNTKLSLGLGVGVAGSPLPVNLLSFEAKLQADGSTQLNWITAGEVDNDYFSIEHSVDGRNFSKIGEERGAGNYSQQKNYQFYHRQPAMGQNYYRLVQYDFSGDFTYSSIKTIVVDKPGAQIKTYPNPVKSQLSIEQMFTDMSDFKIRLTDASGGVIQSLILSSDTIQTIDMSGLRPGTYFLYWQSDQGSGIEKIIVSP